MKSTRQNMFLTLLCLKTPICLQKRTPSLLMNNFTEVLNLVLLKKNKDETLKKLPFFTTAYKCDCK